MFGVTMRNSLTNWRIFLAVLLISVLPSVPALAGPSVVVDIKSGKVLSHQDAFQRWYPASLTKLMTAYLAFRAVKSGELTMKTPVRMSRNAASEPPSKMGYRIGSVMTLDNAIKMMMVKSANDVSVAVGETVSGTEAKFVALMNSEAGRLGMNNTRFANPNGLPDKRMYSTARDLAVLTAAIRREFPQYKSYFATEAIKAGKRTLRSYNLLLGRFAGADGMKTGFVCASGFNLIASATRKNRTLIAVVLGAKSPEVRAEKAAKLLVNGFKRIGLSSPTLSSLKPYGSSRNRVKDMRSEICTAKARKARRKARDKKGKMVIRSPHIRPMNRAPKAIRVGLGGATGPQGKAVLYADVPVPTPRPDHGPVVEIQTEAVESTGDADAQQPEQDRKNPDAAKIGAEAAKVEDAPEKPAEADNTAKQ